MKNEAKETLIAWGKAQLEEERLHRKAERTGNYEEYYEHGTDAEYEAAFELAKKLAREAKKGTKKS